MTRARKVRMTALLFLARPTILGLLVFRLIPIGWSFAPVLL